MLDSTNVCGRNFLEIGFFWNKSPNQTDDIFDRTFLPGVIGIAEVGLRAERIVDVRMEIIFKTIVIGDRTTDKSGMIKESRDDYGSNGDRIIGWDFRDFDES